MSDIEKVIKKINELIPEAPSNWAEQIASKMGKSVSIIREYARGIKGTRNGGTIEVLRQLKIIIEKQKEEIKKLIA